LFIPYHKSTKFAAVINFVVYQPHILLMMTKSLLLSVFLIIYATSAGFVYQGISTLPFAPSKVESIKGNLLLINPFVIREMQLGQSYYDL
jgi:hypothetical protein